ncbi:Proline--tRNA ligase [compost metagenome]
MQTAAAEALYEQLAQLGIEVLLDDRNERAGVKFKDSALLGIPVTIVVGKASAEQKVEYIDRRSNSKEVIGLTEAVSRITSGRTVEG